jgi:hypothetical protein
VVTPLETISALKERLAASESKNKALECILDQVALHQEFEEPPTASDALHAYGQLVDTMGQRLGKPVRLTHRIVVSITVDGNGTRNVSTWAHESVDEAGWATVLAEACMAPLGLLARELSKK